MKMTKRMWAGIGFLALSILCFIVGDTINGFACQVAGNKLVRDTRCLRV